MKIASHADTDDMRAVYATHFAAFRAEVLTPAAARAGTVEHFDFDSHPVAVLAACQEEAS
jgi:hypothetical protein